MHTRLKNILAQPTFFTGHCERLSTVVACPLEFFISHTPPFQVIFFDVQGITLSTVDSFDVIQVKRKLAVFRVLGVNSSNPKRTQLRSIAPLLSFFCRFFWEDQNRLYACPGSKGRLRRPLWKRSHARRPDLGREARGLHWRDLRCLGRQWRRRWVGRTLISQTLGLKAAREASAWSPSHTSGGWTGRMLHIRHDMLEGGKPFPFI